MRLTLCTLFLALGLLLVNRDAAQAQQQPRFGIGIQLMATTVDNNMGPGVRLRTSAPLNQDISFGLDAGFTGYILSGRDDAAYAFDPQASLIVTIPGTGRERVYVLGGGGAYVPFGQTTANSGPTVHAGVGKVWLLNESSFFVEFDPALFVGKETTNVIFPLRVGIIF